MEHLSFAEHDEVESLLPRGSLGHASEQPSKLPKASSSKFWLAITALTVVVVGIAGVATGFNQRAELARAAQLRHSIFTEHIASPLAFKVTNAYGEARYGMEHPFVGDKYVAEPHKEITFTATGREAKDASLIRWEIGGGNGLGDVLIITGHEVRAVFTISGPQTVKMVAIDSAGNTVAEHDGSVLAAYGESFTTKLPSFARIIVRANVKSSNRLTTTVVTALRVLSTSETRTSRAQQA